DAIFAVYAFCRAVDDIADGPIDRQVKHKALNQWRSEIETLYGGGQPKYTIVRALRGPVSDFGLKREDFLAIIDGMQMDADGPVVAPLYAELDLYCDRVAAAVGRLCVCIFGEPGENGLRVANHLGRALQLANILRDVDEDASDGRLYLPRELLDEFGVSHDDPAHVMDQPGFARLWRRLAREAEDEFEAAKKALARCDAHKMRAAVIMLKVYETNLKRMMALSDAELADRRVSKRRVGRIEKLAIAFRHAWT
ncbi:MAG TPA: squalene synthase HpnD, partial [Rhizobiales bacterium]|nr:squalene synthase HpnD [Hyphomicrobiales bacterium]